MTEIDKINDEMTRTHARLSEMEMEGRMGLTYDRGMRWLDELTTTHNTLVRLAQGRTF